MSEVILKMNNISQNFGGVQALKNVSLELRKGEILCLVGENGAGKSTLMNILCGVYQPSKGELYLNGDQVVIKSPMDAYMHGISIVHQELLQIPDMSVAENIFLGRYKRKFGFVDYSELYKRTEKLMDEYDIHFDPKSAVRGYSVANKQLIEILKALSYDSNIIIFDEPTASLTLDESEILFRIVRRLAGQGISVIFISHRLEDIYAIGDRIVVLRDGQMTGDLPVKGLERSEIIRLMVGRDFSQQYGEKHNTPGDVIFHAKNITTVSVSNVSFELKRGEILGIGGLIGAGRTELLRAIFGIDKFTGELIFNGKNYKPRSPGDAIKAGFSMVPEDRKDQGLILMHSIVDNIELNALDRVSELGFMQTKKELNVANDYIEKLEIRTDGPRAVANSLSGGNQQKVVISKSLISSPKVILLDEPTRGVDVGAKAEIYRIIDNLASNGVSIIMVSSELPELIAISDRILVMKEGCISGELSAKGATEEVIMNMAV